MNVGSIPRDRKFSGNLLRSLTTEELLELKELLDSDIAQMKLQIDKARANVITRGEYSDPLWFAKVQFAKTKKGQNSQKIQLELRRRKAEIKTAGGKKFPRHLEQAINELLPADLADKVYRRARELQSEG